jgi:selenocysteine lyase/cysteine desulfurase
VSRWLVHDNFLVDYRPDAGIRIAPHFYTEDREIDAVFGGIERAQEMVRGGQAVPERHAVVT